MTTLSSSGNKRRALYRNLMVGLLVAITLLAVVNRMFGVHLHGRVHIF